MLDSIKCLDYVSCSSTLECVVKAVSLCKGIRTEPKLGIDPGLRYGVTVVLGDIVIYAWEGSEEGAKDILENILSQIKISKAFIGANYPISSSLLEVLDSYDIKSYIVKEDNSSKVKVSGLGKHASSAYLIATKFSLSRSRVPLMSTSAD